MGWDDDARRIVAAGPRPRTGYPRVWLWATVGLTAGAFATAVLMAPSASTAPARGITWLLFVGSSVHVAATGWLYTLPQIRAHARRHRTRYVWTPIGLIAASAVIAAAVSPSTLVWLLLPYFAWQFFHFQKQNLGMAALAASSNRVTGLRPYERRALALAGWAGVAGLMAHLGLLRLRVDPGIGAVFPVVAVLFAGAVGMGLVALARRPRAERPGGFCFVYLTSLLFSLPVFVLDSPYAVVGGMTVAHGLQYLLLIGLIAAGGGQGTRRLRMLAILCDIALVGGVALSAASRLLDAAPAGRLLFGAYLGVLMAHFVVDAGVWRLRDPFAREFLASHVPYLVAPRSGGSGLRPPMDRQPT
ncbi:hypothetical protein [Actinoallomurus acanthiterrae]